MLIIWSVHSAQFWNLPALIKSQDDVGRSINDGFSFCIISLLLYMFVMWRWWRDMSLALLMHCRHASRTRTGIVQMSGMQIGWRSISWTQRTDYPADTDPDNYPYAHTITCSEYRHRHKPQPRCRAQEPHNSLIEGVGQFFQAWIWLELLRYWTLSIVRILKVRKRFGNWFSTD
jgi:hypothetical protein